MAQAQWYELRVVGSVGTSSEIAGSVAIAISENGRLCSIASGDAKRFETEQAAMDYLFMSSISKRYPFEVVCCGAKKSATPKSK